MNKSLLEQENFVSNLPENIIDSIVWYTKDNYIEFNKLLRKEKDLNKVYKTHLNNIDFAFEGVPITKESITVYRGMTTDNIMSNKTFISTSLDFDVATGFTNGYCCILKFIIPSGSKILPIYKISHHPEEMEILLNRHSELTITNKYLFESSHKDSLILKSHIMIDAVYLEPSSIKIKDEITVLKLEQKIDNSLVEEKVKDFIVDTLSDPDEMEMLGLDDEELSTNEKLNILETEINRLYKEYTKKLPTLDLKPSSSLTKAVLLRLRTSL